jgi:hypothetical protein
MALVPYADIVDEDDYDDDDEYDFGDDFESDDEHDLYVSYFYLFKSTTFTR